MEVIVKHSNGMVEYDNGMIDCTEHDGTFLCACYECRKRKPLVLEVAHQPEIKTVGYSPDVEPIEIEKDKYQLNKYINGNNMYFKYEKR